MHYELGNLVWELKEGCSCLASSFSLPRASFEPQLLTLASLESILKLPTE